MESGSSGGKTSLLIGQQSEDRTTRRSCTHNESRSSRVFLWGNWTDRREGSDRRRCFGLASDSVSVSRQTAAAAGEPRSFRRNKLAAKGESRVCF